MLPWRYIVVEGVIGVGKTSLAKLLAARTGGRLNLEIVEENPFLKKFYGDRVGYAFQTQIFFLLSRFRQQQHLFQHDLFSRILVSDYLFAKDRIFANLNLSDDELALYDQLAGILEQRILRPDLVIYLQARTDVLMERIHWRGRPFERAIVGTMASPVFVHPMPLLPGRWRSRQPPCVQARSPLLRLVRAAPGTPRSPSGSVTRRRISSRTGPDFTRPDVVHPRPAG